MVIHSKRWCVLAPLLLLLLPAETASQQTAESQWWWFEDREYYDPLIAGVREAHISAAVGWADAVPFQVEEQARRPSWDIDVGAELPLFGWDSARPEFLTPGVFGVGLWFPIDFHMIEDFVDDSNPIINTDYRFGLMLKARYDLSTASQLGFRAFAGHESTHLGDEFSVRGQDEHPDTFERINVSWEFLDLGVLYRRYTTSTTWSARGGITSTLPFADSYYSTGPESVTFSAVGPVTESSNWIDPHLGLEIEREGETVSGYASSEIRWRTVYDYHKTSADASEGRQLSFNLILGLRKTGRSALGRSSAFLRFYQGVHPHGQFRNQPDFTFIGLGLRLVR
jgi:hypothetical protein